MTFSCVIKRSPTFPEIHCRLLAGWWHLFFFFVCLLLLELDVHIVSPKHELSGLLALLLARHPHDVVRLHSSYTVLIFIYSTSSRIRGKARLWTSPLIMTSYCLMPWVLGVILWSFSLAHSTPTTQCPFPLLSPPPFPMQNPISTAKNLFCTKMRWRKCSLVKQLLNERH